MTNETNNLSEINTAGKTLTIREKVAEAIDQEAQSFLVKSHELNYETLYVDRDGKIWWSDEASDDTRIIDREADEFAAIPALAHVGTGSVRCNCDWCSGPNAVESSDEIEFEGGEFDYAIGVMAEQLAGIPVGYFRDEN